MRQKWKRISNIFFNLFLILTLVGCSANPMASSAISLSANSQIQIEESTTSVAQQEGQQQPNPAKLPITLGRYSRI